MVTLRGQGPWEEQGNYGHGGKPAPAAEAHDSSVAKALLSGMRPKCVNYTFENNQNSQI